MADTIPKPFVFILMPFAEAFDDVYKLGIKPACEKAGAYAERVDEQIFQESILQRTYNQISKADIIVADMTGRNPNVFYETGYAHALGKNAILLTKNANDIPFDLKHYPHIIYGNISDLIPELTKRVRWIIEHPEKPESPVESPVQFFIEGIPLVNSPTIEITSGMMVDLKFDAHNHAKVSIQTATFQIAFLTSNRFYRSHIVSHPQRISNLIKSPEGGLIHFPNISMHILPGAWDSIIMRFDTNPPHLNPGDEESINLRIFTKSRQYDYPFVIKYHPKFH